MIREMFLEEFSLGGEILKEVIQYAVPVALAFGLIILSGLFQFVWQRILLTWRGFTILAVAILALLFQPTATLWIVLLSLFLFTWVEFKAFREGPKTSNPCIVFTGFFCLVRGKDRLKRNANTEHLSSKFCRVLQALISSHSVQDVIPIQAVDYRVPKIVYAFDDAESFRKRMQRYSLRNLSVVWGLTNENGEVLSLEITVDKTNYSGEEFTGRAFADIARVFNSDAVDINAAIDYSASALAALTSQCFCDQLNDDGHTEISLNIARESRRQLELALERLDDGFNAETKRIAQYQRKRLLPCVIREEALALAANDDDRALDRLHEALLLNPYAYLNGKEEFSEFYSNRYVWQSAQQPVARAELAQRAAEVEHKALITLPPNLQLFSEWIEAAALNDDPEALVPRIQGWFEVLRQTHPDDPFIPFYWADAIKFVALGRRRVEGFEVPDDEIVPLPLEVQDAMIQKCEVALAIEPNLPIISSRLFTLYLLSSTHFERDTPEWKFRWSKMDAIIKHGRRFFEENFPRE